MNNKRIEAISQLIDNDESVIDIGCDHGFLAKMLRTKGNNKLIICSDNKIGPLNNARNNLIGYDNINFELTDGVDNIDTVCDVCVLAGMGHNTVISIIENNESYFRNCKKIIIQVNSVVGQMRQYLSNHKFQIIDECMVYDYKYYQIMVVKTGQQQLNELQIEFGPVLLEKKGEVFLQCYQKQLNHFQSLLSTLPENHPDRSQLSKKIEQIKSVL